MGIDLKGRRIIVTGSASGIGAACRDLYAASGAKVAGLDINKPAGGPPSALVRDLVCDVSRRAAVDGAFEEAVGFLGGLDCLCHVAGITGRMKAEDITEEDMRRMFEVNVLGTLFTNQAAFRFMKDKGGSIINFTSNAAIRGQKDEAHYAASKGAVAAFTRAVAHEWGRYNIRVNAIAPMAWTPLFDVARNYLPDDRKKDFDRLVHSMQALPGGLRTPDAVAPLMAFLAAEESSYMTGQTFSIDGGVLMLGS